MTVFKRTGVFALLVLVMFGFGGTEVVSAEESKTCSVPSFYYPTIQVAISLSSQFGVCTEIYLRNQVYQENVDFSSFPQAQDLIIRGRDRKETIIDGGAAGSVFYGSGVNVKLVNLTIQNGNAENGGAIHFTNGSRVTLQDVTLKDNVSTNNGGAVFGDLSTEIIIQDSLLNNNHAGNHGGAISVISDTGKLTITGSVIQDNSAQNDGGGIYLHRASGNIAAMLIKDNSSSDGNGGAVFAQTGDVSIINAAIEGNSAGGAGGAIYSKANPLTLSHSQINNNTAVDEGGALWVAASADIQHVSLVDNVSTNGDGGGIYHAAGLLNFTDGSITGNQALLGGGIAIRGRSNMSRVVVERNTATYFGGGVYLHSGSSTSNDRINVIEDFLISENTAQNGGGVYIFLGRMTIERGEISQNHATGSGGGVDSFNGTLDLRQAAVVNNSAIDSGGGIRANFALLTNATISNNSAGVVGSGLVVDRLYANYVTIADNTGSPAIFNPREEPDPVQFENTIIDNPGVWNCSGESVQAIGVNTIDSDGTCNFDVGRNALNGVDPMLLPLADNGGSSPTHALHPDSPAIGIGIDCEAQDQRNMLRNGDGCDLGAFQTDARVPTAIQLTAHAASEATRRNLTIVVILSCVTVGMVIWRRKQSVS